MHARRDTAAAPRAVPGRVRASVAQAAFGFCSVLAVGAAWRLATGRGVIALNVAILVVCVPALIWSVRVQSQRRPRGDTSQPGS